MINSGVSWNTSSDVLARLNWALEGIETPQIALVVIGGNDGLRSASLQTLRNNIETIIDTLQSKNIQVVLWWMQIPPNLGLSYSHDFKNMYQEIAEAKKVPLIPFFLEGVAAQRELNLADMIHPNEAWYAIIAKNVFDFLLSQKLLVWSK